MDIQLHYIERGAGEPLVLLHGNGESGEYFTHQMDHFAKFYRVIAVDTRGQGKSPRGEAPFTIRQFADDLLEFLDGLGIQKARLLGFSDGANIALIFALRHPERVDRLILNGGNLDPGGVKPSVQRPIVLGWRMASLFAKRSAGARRNAELLGLMVNDPMVDPAELAACPVRTLVIAGTRDMIREAHTRLIYERLPNAELAFVEGDHFVAAKNPQAFNRAVEAFLMG